MTDEGQREFMVVRDWVKNTPQVAGAFRALEAMGASALQSWEHMACIDRMVELGELTELTASDEVGQHRVFIRGRAVRGRRGS